MLGHQRPFFAAVSLPVGSMQPLSSSLDFFLQHLDRHGLSYDFNTAMVLGGAAFRHYFFTPDDNHAWLVEYPGEHWREDSLDMDNYGLFEAVQGHTGWSARRWSVLRGPELVTLLRHESNEARLVAIEGTAVSKAGLIERFDASREGLTLHVSNGEASWELRHSDLTTLDDFVAQLVPLRTLRKEPSEIPASRRHALTSDVLRWAVRHWTSRREIRYDVEAYYATGTRAWTLLEDFARSLETHDAFADADPEVAETYVRTHLQELSVARRSAAEFFGDPAAVMEHTGLETLAAQPLDALSLAWKKSADAAQLASQAATKELPTAIANAHQLDADAFEQLARFLF